MEKRINKKHIFPGILILIFLSIICVVVYKAQIREKLEQPVEYTMMTEHKDTAEVVLSREGPTFSEIFLCKVPELKSLSIELTGKEVVDEARLNMTLYDADTGEIYYQEEKSVRAVMDSRVQNKAEFIFPEPIQDSEGRKLCLTWSLKDAGTTSVHLKANQKQILVSSFNGVEGNGTNVIYTLRYGDSQCLDILYIGLCAVLVSFTALCWWMLIIRRMTVEKFFIPMAVTLGLVFQCLITVGGVPDEPGHLDTAYKYSNKILLVEDTETPGTIYKRICDVEMSDMLANGLESNSYYQLMTNTFANPGDTELIEVSYIDSTNLVPGIVYLPSALGLSVGRILGFSAMLTLQLARIFNLICFVLLVWMAIRLIPFGKNLLAMVAVLPITLQQAASFSYDAIVNGGVMLLAALCFRMWKRKQKEKREIISAVILIVFAAMVKGGVYLPLLLLLFPAFVGRPNLKNPDQRKYFLGISLCAAAVILMAIVKFFPVLQTFVEGNGQSGDNAIYTVPYLLQHPLKIVYLYWNTLIQEGDVLLQGLLGGTLSWLDRRMNWIFQIVFFICLLLMANMEKDRFNGCRREKMLIASACGISIILIMASMLVGYTKISADYIQGLQGRYFLPLALPLFCLTANSMVEVGRRHRSIIWMTMMVAEVLMIPQVAAC
ncbi:MAG TPA: DUF2142 domain-containing protein [Candidatus Blautia excrementipullorum]|nr:DUF2142 domain-containing protein [Candidatus Blautia excrementipullorum]